MSAFTVLSAIALVFLPVAQPANAQSYPGKPIRVIVCYPAGGANDIVARSVGQKMSELLGRPLVVDNRAGAGGTLGADVVAKSPADGYTLLFGAGAHALAPSLYTRLPYDIVADFAPVSIAASSSYVLVVHPSVPARSVRELIALAKTRRGGLNYASSGVGAPPHLAGELFKSMTGVDMQHVAYKGDTPALADLVGGQVDLGFMSISPSTPLIKAARLRALAVTGGKRSPAMPGLPTLDELGLSGYDLSTWWGLLAPAGTPRDAIDKLNAAVAKAVAMPDVKERFLSLGIEPVSDSPEQFAAFIRSEKDKFAKIAKAAGVKPE